MEKESSRFEISLADGRRFGKVDTIYRLGCTHAMRAVVKFALPPSANQSTLDKTSGR
jgi:hypothetical protein